MKKILIGNLPSDTNEDAVRALFATFGTVRSIKVTADLFTGKCRGFGFVEMEGHEARAAQAGLDGKSFGGNMLRVRIEDKNRRMNPRGRR